jgi:hypothetical protein
VSVATTIPDASLNQLFEGPKPTRYASRHTWRHRRCPMDAYEVVMREVQRCGSTKVLNLLGEAWVRRVSGSLLTYREQRLLRRVCRFSPQLGMPSLGWSGPTGVTKTPSDRSEISGLKDRSGSSSTSSIEATPFRQY